MPEYLTIDVPNGDPILVPAELELQMASKLISARIEEIYGSTSKIRTYKVSPYEGAAALYQGLVDIFQVVTTGSSTQIAVQLAPERIVTIYWGTLVVPTINSEFATHYTHQDDSFCFVVKAQYPKKFEKEVTDLLDCVDKMLNDGLLYRGSAIQMRFRDSDGDSVPFVTPKPLEISEAYSLARYSKAIQLRLNREILPIFKNTLVLPRLGITVKKGILLSGSYGGGKSLLVMNIVHEAMQNGWTVIYLLDAFSLSDAYKMAQRHTPCLIVVEDIDEVSRQRTARFNEMLNVIDGIASKDDRIVTVMTTNNLASINGALRRPGRSDIILEIGSLDPETALEILYAHLPESKSINNVQSLGSDLSKLTGASISELANRARMYAFARTNQEDVVVELGDLSEALEGMVSEISLRGTLEKVVE